MIYFFKSELPENKPVFLSLTYIYGLGWAHSFIICKKLGFSTNLKLKDLSRKQRNKLIKSIENLNKELVSELKKSKRLALEKSVSIKLYKGFRRMKGLPVRGQRTHTNAKTAKKRFY